MDLTPWLHLPFLDDTFPLPTGTPFTARTAAENGVGPRDLAALVGAGLLRHPIRNCYVPAQLPDDIATRCECLRLVVPPDAIVVDRHAGWLWGASMLLLPNEHLNVMPVTMDLPLGRGRLRNKLVDGGQRELLPRDVTELHGLRLTTPLRTALDLGRQRWPEPAITALDALHGLDAFSLGELLIEIDRFKGMRWVTTLRLVAPHTDGRSQSGGESVIRWRWIQLPVPPPEPQVEVRSGPRLALIDVGAAGIRAGVEFDGEEWHDNDVAREHDAARRSWLDRDEDWVIEPLVSVDVYGHHQRVEEAIFAVVAEAVRRTRRRPA
ncbi:hypothetical protein SAMN05192575_106135 [Nocardioides alpinus]|uniref:Transcriptional regulator, AbiEi antitoxin, Type IV TA system n=1 Tax=Nocardioides alpinus TaxID=748909 RepID=A0A1I0ZT73_9ACTN|nr:hypothetical protein [Nocardioides alpinus]PKH41878.1 hypothetical protein CXG46_08470 [Nocardioides alpinus]SFB27650.1 hypothetical protein SAMN05192575_106135 [Nocardioides alpinus]